MNRLQEKLVFFSLINSLKLTLKISCRLKGFAYDEGLLRRFPVSEMLEIQNKSNFACIAHSKAVLKKMAGKTGPSEVTTVIFFKYEKYPGDARLQGKLVLIYMYPEFLSFLC